MTATIVPQITESVYEFYRNRPVIVTGATGFLGRHLVSALDSLKAEIYPISSKDVDLRHAKSTETYFDSLEAGFPSGGSQALLMHLAANVSGIHDTSATPLNHLQDNVLMAINVMSNVYRLRIRNMVIAGSVCAYPERAPCPMVEANLWEGKPEPTNFSYGESKRMILSLADAYYQQRMIDNYAFLLSANMYGPGDHFDPRVSHVIPALIEKIDYAIANDTDLVVWGTGRASRDFLNVTDAARAYVLAGYHVMQSRDPIVVNIGSGQEVTIAALATTLARIMHFTGNIVYDDSRPDGQMRRMLSIYQAINRLNWRPSTEFEDGLGKTVKWYKEFVRPAKEINFRYSSSHQISTNT